MTALAKRVEKIKPSFTLEMVSRAADLKSKGIDLINFSAGQPDFNTPNNIIEAAKKAMDIGKTKYTAGSGTLDLRNAICLKIKRENKIDISPSNILVSNGEKLVIKNFNNNQYYIYPLEKTAFNLILDKKFLIEKMRENEGELIENKYFHFKFLEGNYQINIFFDKNTYSIIGWQNVDIYQNLVITYLFNLKKNISIEKNKFKLPSQDYN